MSLYISPFIHLPVLYIKDALLGAQHRGIDVRGIMDRKQSMEIDSQRKIFKELTEAGIPVVIQDHAAIMHLKTIVSEKAICVRILQLDRFGNKFK